MIYLFIVAGIVSIIFGIIGFVKPAIRLAKRLIKADRNNEKLPVHLIEPFSMIIMPIVGYLIFYGFVHEVRLLDWHYILSIWVFLGISIGFYFFSRIKAVDVGPLVLALIPAAMVSGIVLAIIQFIHFLPIFLLAMTFAFSPLVIVAIFALPAFALVQVSILFSVELHIAVRRIRTHAEEVKATNRVQSFLLKFYFGKYKLLAQILTFPVFITIILLVLMLFGQKPDAVVQAFIESGDGLFSQGHSGNFGSTGNEYICTIAAFGSSKLVKPLGYGRRNGHEIIVTRQLQVCNAFEELLQERLPRLQRILRKGYDGLQIPIEKWKQVGLISNTLYVLIKPMEWSFLLVIYFFDTHPEKRIQRQYLSPAELVSGNRKS